MSAGRWDIPKQAFLVENGEVGDCWPCCIAAILNIVRADVPHFLKERDGGSMDADTQRWLNQRGYVLMHVPVGHIWTPRWSTDIVPTPPVIACGPSPRSTKLGQHHAVVCIEGKVVYDPHPSNAGLTYVADEYMIVPAFREQS